MPELRQDIRLHHGPISRGDIAWLLYDPVKHRYFQISRAVFEILGLWQPETAEALAERCTKALLRSVSAAQINEIAKFVIANHLAVEPPGGDARALAEQERRARPSPIVRLAHNYLFFRIPLLRPERFLKATMPLVSPLYTRTAALIVAATTLAGLYLASRQWEAFASTFLDFLSLEGAATYAVALLVVKSLHELGHAYTATRVGVRVNTMGIAFMLMTPILYTDVTDAWRLRLRRDKLAIDAAGIVVELALAGICLFLWSFLPDGPMRSAAFVTATTSLVVGLLVNLNPLMRFDGYYLLSDAWQVPNLQPRSNAMALWWVREALFDLRLPPPEPMARRQRAALVAYALAGWIYRLGLFIGIALIVYHLFFKVLGIMLFLGELVWFVALPIAHEMKEWWNMRRDIARTRRSLVTAAVACGVIALMLVPWRTTVRIQAIVLADNEVAIFAPRPARVLTVAVGEDAPIEAGARLVLLGAPDLDHEIAQTTRTIELGTLRLARIAGDGADRTDRIVLERELARHRTKLAGLLAERAKLDVRSPQAGIARDVDRELRQGEWIDNVTRITRIVGTGPAEARGYVSEDEVWRILEGGDVTFVPEDPMGERLHGTLVEIVATGVRRIDLPYLASVYGGATPSDRLADNEIEPRAGQHLLRATLRHSRPQRAARGTLHLPARGESLAAAAWRRILQVLVRESAA